MEDHSRKDFAHGEITGTETTIKHETMLVVVKLDFTPPVGKVFAPRFTQRMTKCVDMALRDQGGWVTFGNTAIATVPEKTLESFFPALISSFLEHVSQYVPKDPLPDNQSDQVVLEITVSRVSTVTSSKFGLKFPIPRATNPHVQ